MYALINVLAAHATLKLADFGTALVLREEDAIAERMGSPPYMAPEVCSGNTGADAYIHIHACIHTLTFIYIHSNSVIGFCPSYRYIFILPKLTYIKYTYLHTYISDQRIPILRTCGRLEWFCMCFSLELFRLMSSLTRPSLRRSRPAGMRVCMYVCDVDVFMYKLYMHVCLYVCLNDFCIILCK